jgi:hypothetical protein
MSKRHELEAWLGRPCLVAGTIDNWQQNDERGDLGVCLSQCTIEGHDWMAHSDHLWFYVDIETWRRRKKAFGGLTYGRCVGYLGNVEKYYRSNGTVDIGVKSNPALMRLSTYLNNRDKLSLEKRSDLHKSNAIINDFKSNPKQDLEYYQSIVAKDKIEVEQGIARISVGHGVDRDQLGLKIKTAKRITARGFKND